MRNTNSLLKTAMAPLPLLAVLIFVAPPTPAADCPPRNDEPVSNCVIEPPRIAPDAIVPDPAVPERAESSPQSVPGQPEAYPSRQAPPQLLPEPEQQFALLEPKAASPEVQLPKRPLGFRPDEKPSPKALPYSEPHSPDSAPYAKIELPPVPHRPEAKPIRAQSI